MPSKFPDFFIEFNFRPDESATGNYEILKENANRLLFVVFMGLPVSIVHIIILSNKPASSTTNELIWRSGLVMAHSFLSGGLFLIGLLLLISGSGLYSKLSIARLVPEVIFLFILLIGVVIAGIDQLITSSITPYILACILVAVVIRIHPWHSALLYTLAFAIFYLMMERYQPNRDIVVSNQVNGIALSVFGWFLSLHLWKAALARFRKDRIIEQQQLELKQQNLELKNNSEELRKANLTKDRLFSIISHDLRGPVVNLNELLQLSSEGILSDAEFKQLIHSIGTQTTYTIELIENLLAWSRNNLKGDALRPEALQLTDICNDVIKIFSAQAQRKQITIDNRIKVGTLVYADKGMLSLVVRNLISNAIKFSNPNGLILISNEAGENGMQLISISDHGVGITEQVLSKIFKDSYYTTTGTSGEKGTGLGLLLCREFVQKSGGTLQVVSDAVGGTRFTFSVPAAINQE